MPEGPVYIRATPDPRPGSRGYLVWYWTRGPGLRKWRFSPHPWTALRRHLMKYIPTYADEAASLWFHHVFGYWPGSRKGKNPVGPG